MRSTGPTGVTAASAAAKGPYQVRERRNGKVHYAVHALYTQRTSHRPLAQPLDIVNQGRDQFKGPEMANA